MDFIYVYYSDFLAPYTEAYNAFQVRGLDNVTTEFKGGTDRSWR